MSGADMRLENAGTWFAACYNMVSWIISSVMLMTSLDDKTAKNRVFPGC